MTKARAAWLLKHASPFGELPYAFRKYSTTVVNPMGITEPEDKFIKQVWTLMNSNASYYDALVKIREELGEV